MQPKSLTEKGIQRLIKLEINLILQVIGPIKPTGGELIKVSISDGFAFLKDVLLTLEARQGIPGYENSDFMNCVIKVQGLRNIGRQDKTLIVISEFDLVYGNIEDKIGSPIPYQDYKKKGNINGSNLIPGHVNAKKGSFSKQKKQEKRKSSGKDQKSKQHSETEKQNSKKHRAIEPIQPSTKKVSPSKREGPVQYTLIDDLMVDQTGWVILARLTNKSEPRSFVGKKGPSSILSIELMDKTKKTIQGVFFGDIAIKLNQQLEINECYEVSGGNVQMSRAQGNQARQLQLVFHEKSVFKLFKGKQSKQIPFIEDLAIKIKQIIEKDPDQDHGWNIIGVVREQRKLQMLKTKGGKDMAKKTIVVCDPDDKIEIPITLFFNLAQKQFSDEVYIFKGVFVGQYQSKKQFSMSFRSNAIKFPSYRFNNRRDIDDIEFKMGVEESTPNKKSSSLMKVLEDEEKVTEATSLWNRVRCYINAVKTSGTLWYMGCPQCKKKVLVDGPFSCTKCKKKFQMPKYYYILNIQVQDWYSSLWLVVYDQSAKIILDGLEANQAKDMDIDEFRERTKKIKNIGETYQGVFRVRHSGVKLLQIMYEQSAKEHLKKIKEYIYI